MSKITPPRKFGTPCPESLGHPAPKVWGTLPRIPVSLGHPAPKVWGTLPRKFGAPCFEIVSFLQPCKEIPEPLSVNKR